jgi:myo-inositol-1(or 4)-monophosphatase
MHDDEQHQEFLKIAQKAALTAGEVQRANFHKNLDITEKQDSVELMSKVDLKSEQVIVDTIRSRFKDHNILSEETHYDHTLSPYTWVIDPLDGTTNYLFGLPLFSVSIALIQETRLIVGVVYSVILNEMFTAVVNQGAFLNGAPIKTSTVRSLQEALLITGFYYDRGQQMRKNLKVIDDFFQCPVKGIRRFGSAALDLCYIAAGRASGFWEHTLNPWDFAAGVLLVKEAGGIVTDHRGEAVPLQEKSFIVASGPPVHGPMLDVIQKHF